MSLSPEIYAAARSIGLPPGVCISIRDIPVLIAHHRLTIDWVDDYLLVRQSGNVGHVERVGASAHDALFNAVVICAAMIGGVGR